MLDVIHALFEEDITPTWEHGAEVKSKVRESIYSSMYKRQYMYGDQTTSNIDPEWELGGTPTPYDAPEGTVKPYIPPSSNEELMDILGPALGE